MSTSDSGKTTLPNRLLQHESFAHSVVVINEFGEIGLDHLLIATPTENAVVLEGGCMCCKLRGKLGVGRIFSAQTPDKERQFDTAKRGPIWA